MYTVLLGNKYTVSNAFNCLFLSLLRGHINKYSLFSTLVLVISIHRNSTMAHKNKTALITGACGGLGRAIAEKFLIEGGNVVICDINPDLIADFKENVSSAYPECTLVLSVDVTSESALDDMFEQAEEKFGHLDYVVRIPDADLLCSSISHLLLYEGQQRRRHGQVELRTSLQQAVILTFECQV